MPSGLSRSIWSPDWPNAQTNFENLANVQFDEF